MRITIKPPAPPARLTAGTIVEVTVRTTDPVDRATGPVTITREGRLNDAGDAFEFPVGGPRRPDTGTPAKKDFRTPPAVRTNPYADVPAGRGDVVRAAVRADGTLYTAALIAPAPAPGPNPAPIELTLVKGEGAAPQPPPAPAQGLIITPHQHDEDVWTLDTTPGADNIVVIK